MIDAELYERYANALGTNADLLKQAILALEGEFSHLSGANLKTALAARYSALVNTYGNTAAVCAVEFYSQLRALENLESAYEPTAAEEIDNRVLVADVNRAISDAKTPAGLYNSLSGQGVRRAYEQVDTTLINNALLDPAHPKWALVPHIGACGWCVMIASQGFVYYSKATVSRARHAHCKCASVVDFDVKNPKLQGYDPDTLYDTYAKCRKTIEADAKETWKNMPAAEKAKYGTRSNGEKHSPYDHYLRNRIANEMNTRDRNWLQTGQAAKVDYSRLSEKQYENLRGHEKKTWNWLAKYHGIGFSLLPEDTTKPANIDALYKGAFWELKNPKQGKHAIEDRIKDGCKKWEKLGLKSSPKIIVCNSESGRSDKEAFNESIRRCKWYGADELLFLSHDGKTLYRWTKKKG